jgi:hypothetical protein
MLHCYRRYYFLYRFFSVYYPIFNIYQNLQQQQDNKMRLIDYSSSFPTKKYDRDSKTK